MIKYTPMMEQYLEVKKGYLDALVFYRLGDFYEMFFDDAKIASSELDLVLTGRNAGVEEKVPMCGVPHHAATTYIQRLVQKGYKVAIVEQLEDPSTAQGIVKRDVIKVVTPGTVMDDLTDEKNSIYLASIIDYQYGFALSVVEMSTGETFIKNVDRNWVVLTQTILKNNIKEVVVKSSFDEKGVKILRELGNVVISYCDETSIEAQYIELCEEVKEERNREAYGLMLHYLEATQKKMLGHLQLVEIEREDDVLYMDFSTQQNLELVIPLRAQSKSETLWSFMDRCQSAMGSRLLKKWVEKPLVDKKKIELRLDRVEILMKDFIAREELKENLSKVYDVQRLIARVAMGSANAMDCIRLQKTLNAVPAIFDGLKGEVFDELKKGDRLQDLHAQLEHAFVENPPLSTKEGGMFQDGYDAELDEIRIIQRQGKDWILQLENAEKEKTGIRTLKIGYNRVFGYYIEVSKGANSQIKDEFGYIRKQTLTNCERYVTQDLKEKEDAILHAEERLVRRELQLFQELLEKIKRYLPKLQKLAAILSEIDCYYAMSSLCSEQGYIRPVFTDKDVNIVQGRHPILDKMMKEKRYVANDLMMNDENEILIITGPNMGGKSTYMRQVALNVVLAQMGCFVPCKKCEIPLFDKIFTRIGASDDILSGQSTFMVEMSEANHALTFATEKSLILFDEIGRGTSTYDGMALAQAMIEYISTCIHAKTLFSTHYHELTALEDSISCVKNVHVEVHEEDDHVTFMYRVKKGKADRSYGINVAKLAKLPESVLSRAKDLLKELESHKRVVQQSYQIVELKKEATKETKIVEMLDQVNPNELTPIQALQMIIDLKDNLK
ncbi:DNA mismatch repair protein MutS [Anaerorhabdus sp.]|uniref:DNA mismatch repair protein MutS n=1 Tax=Anaerorhabdus sp. TaxID=1872524 RepID=UPI002FCB4D1E